MKSIPPIRTGHICINKRLTVPVTATTDADGVHVELRTGGVLGVRLADVEAGAWDDARVGKLLEGERVTI